MRGARRTAVLTDQPLLEVRDVAKYFGSVNALQDISLKVYAGEVTCVLPARRSGAAEVPRGQHPRLVGRVVARRRARWRPGRA